MMFRIGTFAGHTLRRWQIVFALLSAFIAFAFCASVYSFYQVTAGAWTDNAGWYLEVQDCSWHLGRNPRELKRWMVDLNAVKAEASRQGWTPQMCLTVRPSATLDWIAYCEMHDLFAACGMNQVKNIPGR